MRKGDGIAIVSSLFCGLFSGSLGWMHVDKDLMLQVDHQRFQREEGDAVSLLVDCHRASLGRWILDQFVFIFPARWWIWFREVD